MWQAHVKVLHAFRSPFAEIAERDSLAICFSTAVLSLISERL